MTGTSSEERRDETEKDGVHKTKLVQFLGRTTPIILQNDNGPCPLLAICNVLLLRNNLSLSPETTEVSQEKLLSLVAERLIDSNSNVDNKDAGYVQNQQQNIADAIDLLPRLATGIDVNIKFKRIDDFEFTRECAIFDLLDIPLYHGWIVDPQDQDTTTAIGSKSYNALMGELVVLDTQNTKDEWTNGPEEDSIDFAAATTATLGVPSPSLSRGRSFDCSPHSDLDHQKSRKGDIEEEVELLRVLQLSKANVPNLVEDSVVLNSSEGTCPTKVCTDEGTCPTKVCTDEGTCPTKVSSIDPGNVVEGQTDGENMSSQHLGSSIFDDYSTSRKDRNDVLSFETFSKETICSSSKTVESNDIDQGTAKSGEGSLCNNIVEEKRIDLPSQTGGMHSLLHVEEIVKMVEKPKDTVGGEEHPDPQSVLGVDIPEPSYSHSASDTTEVSPLCESSVDSHSSNGRQLQIHARDVHCSNVDGNEPIYEGEDCTLDSRTTIFVDREPIYEGEVILAEQADKGSIDVTSLNSKEITPREGELIRNFLRNNASQLTICGLFSLQDGLKERELCVFFRNNHFSTMFKIDGELYLLATDQGYITQSDLVWEKLNEVNGDTLFMTGNFKEFKVENHADGTWDEHNALANTADYLASIDHSAQAGSNFNSDLQLAIALQQQEFEQQPQRETQTQKPPPVSGSSRLVTGPQVPRNSNRTSSVVPPTVAEPKSKEKCTVM